ncbi:hypothetical protein AB0L00_01670 [Actinoallomurus sp. NPDC052308]|uniref:hypothetical protein n=1 Tax=Actinoallomurus sp. NPDC052308 TaxID=3155530 RepID=UPI003411FD3F
MNKIVTLRFLASEGDAGRDATKGGSSGLDLEVVVADRSTRQSVEELIGRLDLTYEGDWTEEDGGVHRLRATIRNADQADEMRLENGLDRILRSAAPKAGHSDGYPATSC